MAHEQAIILNTVNQLPSGAEKASRWLEASQRNVETEFGVHLYLSAKQIARIQEFHEMARGQVQILNTVKRLASRAIMATRWLVASQWSVGKEFGVHPFPSVKVSAHKFKLQHLYLSVNLDPISWN